MLKRTMKLIRRVNSERGFSLIENMIAAAIFTVGILSTTMLFTQTLTFTNYSEKFSVATNLGRGELERLRNTPFANVVSGTTEKTVDNFDFVINWVVTSNDPVKSVKNIKMTVSWTDMRGDHEIEIETIFSRF